MGTNSQRGHLFLVATPIGCLDDMTLRAIRVLREADAILAEDTRRSRVLCQHHGIERPLHALHEHTSDSALQRWAERMVEGETLALISDAGMPTISDPGHALVRLALERDVAVEVIPGPSALTTALAVSGIAAPVSRFEGFLPRGGSKRRAALQRIEREPGATVIFEAPSRVRHTLQELQTLLGPGRQLALCRELTKMHEEVLRGDAAEVLAALGESPRGEITLVIAGAEENARGDDNLDHSTLQAAVERLVREGLSTKDIVAVLVEAYSLPRNEAYRAVLELQQKD